MARRGRGFQQAIGIRFGGDGSEPHPKPRSEFRKVVALWIPRRFFEGEAIDVGAFVADVNEKIERRGFVLWNGQVLTTAIDDIDPTTAIVALTGPHVGGHEFQGWIRLGKRTELIHEKNPGGLSYEVPPLRKWSRPQQEFFGIENPYQMGEERDDFSWSHITTSVTEAYISEGEQIAGLIHGAKDDHYFYCPCHFAEVVYTTRHRLVCMACGATHVVLREPLKLSPKRLLTAAEWLEYFDDSGMLRDEDIELSIVDFRDVEDAEFIWCTDQWEDAKHEFVFFARSSPEVISEAIRGTERDPLIFLEAGWAPMETPVPPAHQIASDAIDVDLLENASHAFSEGASSFVRARKDSGKLVSAIPQLFRAVELVLKAKLSTIYPEGLKDQPNNPTVLDRLAANGVSIGREERDGIDRLRGLRNDLQHGRARLSHRAGLAVSRKAILFVDRFGREELGRWIGDIVAPDDFYELLQIPEIGVTSRQIVAMRVEELRGQPGATVSLCQRCGEEAMARAHPRTGASCLLCGYVHVETDAADGDER